MMAAILGTIAGETPCSTPCAASSNARSSRAHGRCIYPNKRGDEEKGSGWTVADGELKDEARKRSLWNLFLPESDRGAGLTNLVAHLCGSWAARRCWHRAYGAQRPTGSMEVLERAARARSVSSSRCSTKKFAQLAMTGRRGLGAPPTFAPRSRRRQRLRHQWPQMVDLGAGDKRKIMIVMGRTIRRRQASAAEHDPRVAGRGVAAVIGFLHEPGGHWGEVRKCASGVEHLLGEPRLRIAQNALAGASIIACALSAWPSARWR